MGLPSAWYRIHLAKCPTSCFTFSFRSVVQPFQTAHRFCFAANVGRICVVFSHLWRVELILKLGKREMKWHCGIDKSVLPNPQLMAHFERGACEKDKTTFSCEGFAKHFRYLSLSRTMIAISGDLGVKAGSCSSEVLRWQETILLIPSCCKALLAEKSRRQMYVMQSLFCSAWGPKEREW